MLYVELTRSDGRVLFVNPNHVESIQEGGRESDDLAFLRFHSGAEITVRGHKKAIARELADAVLVQVAS